MTRELNCPLGSMRLFALFALIVLLHFGKLLSSGLMPGPRGRVSTTQPEILLRQLVGVVTVLSTVHAVNPRKKSTKREKTDGGHFPFPGPRQDVRMFMTWGGGFRGVRRTEPIKGDGTGPIKAWGRQKNRREYSEGGM